MSIVEGANIVRILVMPKLLREIPIVEIPRDTETFDPALVDLVLRAFTDIGFLFVRAQRLPQILPFVYGQFRQFFSLPMEQKMRYAFPEIFFQRGYTPLRQEIGMFCRNLPGRTEPLPDEKECYMMASPDLLANAEALKKWPKLNTPNVWPGEVRDFDAAMTLLYHSLYPIGEQVLRVLNVALGKPVGFFDDMLAGGPTVMRAIHYPPLSAEDIGNVIWGCGHTDINLVTVLPASSRSGLMIRLRKSKEYIPGRAPEGCVIVQAGDMLKVLTKSKIASAIHEVRAPTEPTTEGRFSAALFMHPRSDALLTAAKTAGQFLDERLKAIGLY